ncbi:MAG TPA: ImmA/IrrE family metallo-endopeptidase [Actinocrinis sp.]|jgi:Zn-dependent peptidase ImmA (M78 family)|uniref:ImmA/IrrE family metallo-endopeptidase n=1 Tax=Actinocrinis sp. TaxID=1920516 RepID=UPI002DDD2BD2|nr:ImmA/IrrE family metallo-endopeptidase [Actinocrinis sp.]HEV3173034.1 ImmA/IrrE family metallo-endopeptidase [Actinocrinis sp.]
MSPESDGRARARQFRDTHHLGVQPLGDLVAVIEQSAEVDVAILDADPDEHGMAMRDPARGAVFIGVARSVNPMRQRSTLAHELGHVLFEDWTDSATDNWSERDSEEVRADAFARYLLIPIEGLQEFLGAKETVVQADLSAVVQRFLVSPAIAAIALHEAGYIDQPTKAEWMSLYTPHLAARFGWSDQYRVLQADSDQRRAPQRLLARAIRGYAEGVLPAQAIATLRGIPVEDAEADLRAARIAPPEHPVMWADYTELPEVNVDVVALEADLSAPDDEADSAAAERDAR